ncbi:MAG: DUF2188 domain-containing protein [Acholeplasmatales bacterium]|nr:DUF2188 domain-containing protein [Acholeplasmatales bacterium]
MATVTKTKTTTAAKKDTAAPVKKSPSETKKAAPAKTTAAAPAKAAPAKAAPATKSAPAKPAPKPKKAIDMSKMSVKTPTKDRSGAEKTTTGKTAYHVSKRDNDGREWKVFIQGSDKVIKLFDTQKEALDYAKTLAKNKDDGSYVILHGLDGKIRKY